MRTILMATAAAATVFAGLGVAPSAFAQQGSYSRSCRNTQTANGVLIAECADGQGRYHSSSIPYGQCRGDIANINGILTCQGATASGGGLVAQAAPAPVQAPQGPGRPTDNRGGYAMPPAPAPAPNNGNRSADNRNNSGSVAAGVIAGALLGGALTGNSPTIVYGAPGRAPPARHRHRRSRSRCGHCPPRGWPRRRRQPTR